MMEPKPYVYFHVSLQNHRYFDEHVRFPKVEPLLWEQWAFDDKGVYWLAPIERDLQNLGARLFDNLKSDITAELFAWYNQGRLLQ